MVEGIPYKVDIFSNGVLSWIESYDTLEQAINETLVSWNEDEQNCVFIVSLNGFMVCSMTKFGEMAIVVKEDGVKTYKVTYVLENDKYVRTDIQKL